MITAMFTIGFGLIGAAISATAGNAVGSKLQQTKAGQSASDILAKTRITIGK
jgi:hypothetical protein